MLERLRERVYKLHLELPKQRLVTMTSGNISGRDPETGYVVIKPSGVKYETMSPDDLVVVDLEGNRIKGDLKASTDTRTHLYVYRQRKDVNGIVHTHSPYATSFAALDRPIPCVLTAMTDEFGGPIPVGPYARIGGTEIGEAIVEHIGDSSAILLKNHGVFTIGNSLEAALKSAVMTEDVARTVHLAMLLGSPERIPDEEVERAHRRYKNAYGQEA